LLDFFAVAFALLAQFSVSLRRSRLGLLAGVAPIGNLLDEQAFAPAILSQFGLAHAWCLQHYTKLICRRSNDGILFTSWHRHSL